MHGRHTRIPPADHRTLPDGELEEAGTVPRGIELGAIEQLTHVVHRDLRSRWWRALRRVALRDDGLEDTSVSGNVVARPVVLLMGMAVAVTVAALLVAMVAARTVLVAVLSLLEAVVAPWTVLVAVLVTVLAHVVGARAGRRRAGSIFSGDLEAFQLLFYS